MDTQEKIIIYQVFTRLFGNNSLRVSLMVLWRKTVAEKWPISRQRL